MPSTDIGYAATRPSERKAYYGSGASGSTPLSSYALAMRCPVLSLHCTDTASLYYAMSVTEESHVLLDGWLGAGDGGERRCSRCEIKCK
eukprot:1550865-Rhodomonas_salina.3